ncbi:hypothetical protein BG842_19085 [Haladaptatus sp. W1]|nr:hypothetical protein [Haladaptatus sp. W1]ODR82897.1 hypothetical protein BG842_19085 [Haladaptatus sp. W1]
MTIEKRGDAHLITHAMAKDTLSKIRDEETEQVGFRKGLVKLGRICGYEIIDGASTLMITTSSNPLTRSPVVSVSGVSMETYSVSIAPSMIS